MYTKIVFLKLYVLRVINIIFHIEKRSVVPLVTLSDTELFFIIFKLVKQK